MSTRSRLVRVVLAVLAVLVVAPAGALAQDSAPYIRSASVTPGSLGHEGGTVAITADAVDDYGIFMMYAQVYHPDGSGESVMLLPCGETAWCGQFTVPPNDTDQPVSWGFEIQATSNDGQYAQLLANDVQVAAQPQFDEPPNVFDPTVEPRALPAAGGQVRIGLSATDLRGIQYALARVTRPDGTSVDVALEAVSASRFEGVYDAPANTGTTTATYRVLGIAADDACQETSIDAGTFTVAARPTVAPGKLTIAPWSGLFTPTRVGRTTQHAVVIRNTVARGGAPITAAVSVSGAAFALIGPSSVVLAPGQSTKVTVAFRPTSAGLKTGSLKIVRADGRQPGLSVALLGVGLRR